MKKFFISLIAVVCLASHGFGQNASPVKVRALKDNTNLRAKAGLNVEVAGQVAVNQELTVKSMDFEWVEVVAPTNIDFWVLGDYLKDDLVVCRQTVNVRVGPGLNFSIVGQLRNGDKVEIRGSHTGWIKIAPAESCSLWVSRPLVEIVQQTPPPAPIRVQAVKPPVPVDSVVPRPGSAGSTADKAAQSVPKKPEPAEPPKVVLMTNTAVVAGSEEIKTREAAKTPAIKPPEDLDLIPEIGQGQIKQFEGTLKTKNFLVRSPSDFRLVVTDPGGQPRTICFVKGNRSQLKALLFRELVVIGRQYWVHRSRQPVVVPEKIIIK